MTQHSMPFTNKARLSINNNIQYLRGIAAVLVVIDHSMLRLAHGNSEYLYLKHIAGDLGAFGVQIFFVISGYLMVVISADEFGPGQAAGFIWSRLKRIFPLYLLATLAMVVLGLVILERTFSISDILLSLFFIATDARPEDGALRPVWGVGWTLNYEMFFYAIFSFGLLMPRKFGLSLTMSAVVTLAVLGQVAGRTAGASAINPFFAFYTDEIMLLFVAGMILALWRSNSALFFTLPVPHPAIVSTLAAIIGLLVLSNTMPTDYPVWRTLLVFGAAAACVAVVVSSSENRLYPWLRILGDASYSIYLFHGFALDLVAYLYRSSFGSGSPSMILLCALAGLLVGCAIYFLVERPLVAFLKRF